VAAVAADPAAARSHVLIGFMGDPVAGAECGHRFEGRTAEEGATQLLAAQGYSLRDVEMFFPRTIAQQILEDVEHLWQECLLRNSVEAFAEYYFCVERQAKLIAHIFNMIPMAAATLSFPYLDGDWARFFHSLHPRHRVRRRIHRLAISIGVPRLDQIGDTSPHGGFVHRRQRALRHFQSAVEVASGGRWTIPNPYQTENLPAVVNQFLRPILIPALAALRRDCLVTSALATRFERPRYSSKGIHGMFRIISMHQILNSPIQAPETVSTGSRAPRSV
jgi:hypothetical protein